MLCSRFNSSSHVYFVTVQKKSYLPGEAEAGYVTRISRTCVTDANFDTYSEVTLECRLGGDNYNLVQDAVTLPASKKLAEDLGVSEGDQVLVAVFAPGRDMTSRPQGRTCTCASTARGWTTSASATTTCPSCPRNCSWRCASSTSPTTKPPPWRTCSRCGPAAAPTSTSASSRPITVSAP